MGMFDKLDVDKKELGADKVSDGGGVSFYKIKKTGVHLFTIKNAWAGMSEIKEFNDKKSGGAFNIVVQLEGSDGQLNTFEFVTAGVQKDRKPTFVYDKYRKLHYLLTGEEVEHIPTELKPVMVWDNQARQEVEVEKEVITAWVGKKIVAACERTLEDKFNADGEMKDFVVVRSFLDADTNRSYAEVKQGTVDADYYKEFVEKRDEDYIVDKRKSTKGLPIPVALSKVEEDAQRAAEKAAKEEGGGFDGGEGNPPEIDINEDEIPF